MRKMKLLLVLFLLFTVAFSQKSVAQIIITEKSKVTFSVSHMTGTVEGTIMGMQGTVNFDENNLTGSTMQASVEAKTVDTGNNARDSDLRKDKFFQVERYPQVKFQSRTISKTAEGYQVTGDLTIKARTREVIIPFQREVKNGETIYTGQFSLNRKDYDLGKSAFPPMGKTVKVNIVAIVK